MGAEPIETDYFVIGAGACAMAFVDTLLTETDARVAMVDRRHRAGGHWNDAYSFVGLHQPSEFYGVASRELSGWTKDESGLNQGLYGLASGADVLDYFDQVMRQRFLSSGRVQFFPMSNYAPSPDGKHVVTSLLTGRAEQVLVRKKLVDATHARTETPSTHPPKYRIGAGVACAPLNRLPEIKRPYAVYTVVGSGKTGMDACIWLLQNGVPPSRIRWIMPRDAWMMDRANMQPGVENFERSIGKVISQFEAIAEATSLPHLFEALERRGLLLRIDGDVEPTTYRCANISRAELEQLRRIKHIVRLGRLRAIERTEIVLDQGALPADPDTFYIDCSASAIQTPPALPVFEEARINLLMVRFCQPLFSAALIAYVESHFADRDEKNALCSPVPSPELPIDWLRMWSVSLANATRWRADDGLRCWLAQCRLNNLNTMMRGMKPNDPKLELLKESGAKATIAAARIPALLAAIA